MAKKLGYKSKSGYCMLENGITKLTLHKAKLIAEILEVEPSIFFENHIQATSIYEIKNTTK